MASPPEQVARPATIRDVAAAAAVSIGTASKALNGRGRMRDETRDRVLAAAERLGFRPNPLAQGLLAGRTYTVGLVTGDSYGRFSIPVMLGAEDALGAGKISVFLCDTRDDPIRERHYLERLLARRVEGIIVTGRRTEPRPSIGHDLPVPVVYAMTQSTDESDYSIIPDDRGGGVLATRHLLATGRARVGHITGPEGFQAARERAAGLTATLAEAGLAPAGEILFGEWSEEWGRQAADILLHAAPDVDAVFCGSDQIARGVAETLRERGRRVPDDVALVGFDNWEPMALGCRPPLTTVDMNLGEIGRLAARHLLDAIAGEPVPSGVHVVPAALVPRASTRRSI
ncbi:LacI family DNA-binding transcriptional regulator [Nonomuraea wenchangensis]|uniref:LacI family transcriptional regulator n=1 Tax=Nonomuraea wenchangensis TaxID=568860 RepID=A0A1I0L8M8_9ACTN|nr:LacI family DNA-binding transcriptional regulator [Nonomuraea wenchangensis]SEU35731.1 LacI family transcriptional regulator [Nonomuraea wenchangensis]